MSDRVYGHGRRRSRSRPDARERRPGIGAFAYFKDPEGNVMGLWETVS